MNTTSEPTKRMLQLAEDIRSVVAKLFAHGEIRDPRLHGLTILHVKVTADLNIAKVYYMTPHGADKELINNLLKPVSRYIRKVLGDQLMLRHIPEVHFYYDDNVDHSIKINELLAKL